ncbi:MAG: general stress protein [Tissierella sp.]|uniref:general stress protein n=1 Tax=Tissierella sp. TaxID=41274 RepID=UPI003F9B5079
MSENKVELFENELQVLKRIEELKAEGYKEDDMYIIVSESEEIKMLKGSTNIMIKKDDDSLYDKFKNFLKGNDSIIDAFNRMDLDDKYRDTCYEEVHNGKILLMVNEDYESKFELTKDGLMVPKKDLKKSQSDSTLSEDNILDSDNEGDSIEDNLGFEARKEKNVVGNIIATDIEKDEIKNR